MVSNVCLGRTRPADPGASGARESHHSQRPRVHRRRWLSCAVRQTKIRQLRLRVANCTWIMSSLTYAVHTAGASCRRCGCTLPCCLQPSRVRRWARARLLKVTRCRASWLETERAEPVGRKRVESVADSCRTGNGGYLWSGIVHPSWVGILIASLGSQRRLVALSLPHCHSWQNALHHQVHSVVVRLRVHGHNATLHHDKRRLETKQRTAAEGMPLSSRYCSI